MTDNENKPAAALEPFAQDDEYKAFVAAHRASMLATVNDPSEEMIIWHANRHWNGKPGEMWRARAALAKATDEAEYGCRVVLDDVQGQLKRAESLLTAQEEWLPFLTDVVTASGLLSHGKKDKVLAERISKRAYEFRVVDVLVKAKASAVPEGLDDGAAIRLRAVCKLLGLENAVPEDDAQLWGCAFSVLGMIRSKLQDQDAHKAGTLYAAIQRAAGELPEGWTVRLEVERDAGWVELIDEQGDSKTVEGNDGYLCQAVNDAIDEALSRCPCTTTGDAAIGEKGNG